MPKMILPKHTSKLNLNRRQTSLLAKIILTGNRMAEMLAELEFRSVQPKAAKKLAVKWSELMAKLANLLL